MSAFHQSVARELAQVLAAGREDATDSPTGDERYEWAWNAIEALNNLSLSELANLQTLSEQQTTEDRVLSAMQVALDPESTVYALGWHVALFQRVFESLGQIEDEDEREQLICEIKGIITAAVRSVNHGFSFLLRLVLTACENDRGLGSFSAVDPATVAIDHYCYRRAKGNEDVGSLVGFLDEKGMNLPASQELPSSVDSGAQVILFVLQRDTEIPLEVAYGSQRITMEAAKCVKRAGHQVALIGCSECRIGVTEGLLFLGCKDDLDVLRCVRQMGCVDAVIGVSRADAVAVSRARRTMVYHHGPHPVQGVRSNAILRRFRTPIVCLSQSSARQQVGFGLRRSQASHVYSGFDMAIFCEPMQWMRDQHRMLCAGNIVDYKGTDIAVKAFDLLRDIFPDASLDIYGDNLFNWKRWMLPTQCFFREDWLRYDGTLDTQALSREILGVSYHGQVDAMEMAGAYRRSSVLVMPSRVPETFGLVSVEAQACGCIPVLPRNGAFPETMIEGETGYLYEPNTPEELARTIAQLWSKELPSDDQRDAAARSVKNRFSWDKTGEGVLKALYSQRRRSRLECRLMYWHWLFDALHTRYGSVFGIAQAMILKLFGVRRPEAGSRRPEV